MQEKEAMEIHHLFANCRFWHNEHAAESIQIYVTEWQIIIDQTILWIIENEP